jgi:MoxR-like ATPase
MFITLAAKARALMAGRYHVTREDISHLALPVLRHRVLANYFAESDGMDVDKVLKALLEHFDAGNVQHARAS